MSADAFRLDHVAIAVKDLDGALAVYRDVLGMPVGGVERVADQQVDVAFVGEEPGRIELISPFTDGSIQRFIDKRGEGLHHVAVRVPETDIWDVRPVNGATPGAPVARVIAQPVPRLMSIDLAK